MDVDYAHTPTANARREQKARALACWCWDRGVLAADLDAADFSARRSVAKAAGVHEPRGPETWQRTVELLQAMAVWAARHPDDERAGHRLIQDRPVWLDLQRRTSASS